MSDPDPKTTDQVAHDADKIQVALNKLDELTGYKGEADLPSEALLRLVGLATEAVAKRQGT